jgi:hypothetical protein
MIKSQQSTPPVVRSLAYKSSMNIAQSGAAAPSYECAGEWLTIRCKVLAIDKVPADGGSGMKSLCLVIPIFEAAQMQHGRFTHVGFARLYRNAVFDAIVLSVRDGWLSTHRRLSAGADDGENKTTLFESLGSEVDGFDMADAAMVPEHTNCAASDLGIRVLFHKRLVVHVAINREIGHFEMLQRHRWVHARHDGSADSVIMFFGGCRSRLDHRRAHELKGRYITTSTDNLLSTLRLPAHDSIWRKAARLVNAGAYVYASIWRQTSKNFIKVKND